MKLLIGTVEVQITGICVSGTGFLGLLPETDFCGYLMIKSVLPTSLRRWTRQKATSLFLIADVFARV
jgi:hypothetical protein